MEIRSILVPTDFSRYSERAYQQARSLAERENAQVLLLHVLLSSDLAFGDTPLPMREQLEKEMQIDAEQRLKSIAEGQTIPIETLAVWGNPPTEICRIAKERDSDLIVMGTHGRTGLTHLFIGSVAERVVRHAPCSVLIVRTPREDAGLLPTSEIL